MRWNWAVAMALLLVACVCGAEAARDDQKKLAGDYKVLDPLQSGGLTLFPVVRAGDAGAGAKWEYIALDEGLRSGAVEVTEYGKVSGMVRPHGGHVQPIQARGDRVNTLVLINKSDRPLLLLAGEIVTGGKQDRVIGKDRVVPPHSDPIDLSVFCIEPGRWVGASDRFGAVGKSNESFMVQPSVREKAMVAGDQQQVWNSVHSATETVEVSSGVATLETTTTSYAQTLNDRRVKKQIDKVAEPLTRESADVLKKLRDQHAVGVVVAVDGGIVWADIFATPEMLAAYWTKLVRSYAAESFDHIRAGSNVTVADAQKFVDRPAEGTESSEGETGIYRYREVRGDTQSTFYLQVLASGKEFYAHISRVAEENGDGKLKPTKVEGGYVGPTD